MYDLLTKSNVGASNVFSNTFIRQRGLGPRLASRVWALTILFLDYGTVVLLVIKRNVPKETEISLLKLNLFTFPILLTILLSTHITANNNVKFENIFFLLFLVNVMKHIKPHVD